MTVAGGPTVRRALDEAHRREWAFVVAAAARLARDLDLAEECAQDAFVRAAETWPRHGVPANPGAWLTTVATRRVLDLLRRERVLRGKLPLLVDPRPAESDPPVLEEATVFRDDRLRLVFTCCHPALAREAQVALTLRLVCGLATPDIAAAFLVSESTMAARLTRAKHKIAAAGIPYRVPTGADLPDRLDAVLDVVHLLFTAGHAAPRGDALVRPDVVERALQLGRTLRALLPDEREVAGLLALMVVTDARRATRVAADGSLVLLEDQDRRRWDRAGIAEGGALVVAALRGGRPGRFALQAAIASLHAEAPSAAETDWAQILHLYDLLLRVWPSPVVALNRAVAVAMVDGPDAGLAAVDALAGDARLDGYAYLPATRADLLRRLGRHAEAAEAYRAALRLTANGAEQAFLAGRLAGVER